MSFDPTNWNPDWYATASDESKLEFKAWLSNILSTQTSITVKFIKANGDDRIMNCTLNPAVVNAAYEEGSVRPMNEILDLQAGDAYTVWDLDVENWRCFRLDRLKEITYDQ
jgi:hypothetical protein